jgi:hypothetical protein
MKSESSSNQCCPPTQALGISSDRDYILGTGCVSTLLLLPLLNIQLQATLSGNLGLLIGSAAALKLSGPSFRPGIRKLSL